MSSMVLARMGFNASDTGRQFSFKYWFVLSSVEITTETFQVEKWEIIIKSQAEKAEKVLFLSVALKLDQ